MSKSKCKSCGVEIMWLKTRAGKNIPVDIPKMEIIDGMLHGESANEAVTTAHEFNPDYMVSHFATCPHAKQHRK